MSDFSRLPKDVFDQNRAKGYSGLHFMQGVPILDRDLNLMQDLINETVRSLVSRYLGNGVPLTSDGFKITPAEADNDFQISANALGPGFCLINGIEVVVEANTPYSKQPRVAADALPPLTKPASDRTDNVYLDVFVETVDTDDDILGNHADIAMQTSVRLRTAWTVRVAEGVAASSPPLGHTFFPLAELKRKQNVAKITAEMIVDKRQRCIALDTVFGRLITPEITSVDPPEAKRGNKVTIFGRNFDALAGKPAVAFGSRPVPVNQVTKVNAISAVVTVPEDAPTGEVQLTVSNDAGSSSVKFAVST